jgi:hypothetical protein
MTGIVLSVGIVIGFYSSIMRGIIQKIILASLLVTQRLQDKKIVCEFTDFL